MSESTKQELESIIALLLDEIHKFSVLMEEDESLSDEQWLKYDSVISKLNLMLKELQEEINFL